MLRALLDTNVLIAARRSARGASAALLADLSAGRWRLVLSNTVLAEYEEVLKREAAARRNPGGDRCPARQPLPARRAL